MVRRTSSRPLNVGITTETARSVFSASVEMPKDESTKRRTIGVFGAQVGPEEIEELSPSILNGWMGMGARVREFEEELGTHVGQSCVMTNSGSSALHLAVAALDLPPGSEVVVPALT